MCGAGQGEAAWYTGCSYSLRENLATRFSEVACGPAVHGTGQSRGIYVRKGTWYMVLVLYLSIPNSTAAAVHIH